MRTKKVGMLLFKSGGVLTWNFPIVSDQCSVLCEWEVSTVTQHRDGRRDMVLV